VPKHHPPPDSYRESHPLESRGYAWVWLLFLVLKTAQFVTGVSHGDMSPLWGVLLLLMWTVGISILVEKQEMRVTRTEVQIHNPPFLTKRWPLTRVHRLEKRDRPPGSWRDRWPLGQWRIYAPSSGSGLALHFLGGGGLYWGSVDADRLLAAILEVAPHAGTIKPGE
jgi:hypothetical protein